MLNPLYVALSLVTLMQGCNKWFSNDINNIPGVELDKLTSLTGYKQLIDEATNFEPNKSKTCIDLIFSSQPNLISDSGVHPSLFQTCHHQIIYDNLRLILNFIYHLLMKERSGVMIVLE